MEMAERLNWMQQAYAYNAAQPDVTEIKTAISAGRRVVAMMQANEQAAVRLLRSSEETCPEDLDRLAQAVGLSAAHLSRLFHAQVGQSVTEFRSRQRLERFFRLYGAGRRLTRATCGFS